MTIKEEIQYKTGLNDNLILEGIKFFKNSGRIQKLIEKINNKLLKEKDEEIKNDMIEYVKSLEEAQNKFKDVEQLFSSGKKDVAKAEYKNLVKEYSALISKINKKTIINFFLGTGLAYLLFFSFATFLVSGFIPLTAAIQSGIEKIKFNGTKLNGTTGAVAFNKNQKTVEDLGKLYGGLE
jgi:hypothetical protein